MWIVVSPAFAPSRGAAPGPGPALILDRGARRVAFTDGGRSVVVLRGDLSQLLESRRVERLGAIERYEFFGGMSEANTHSRLDIPTLLVGGGAHGLQGNRHIQAPKETPSANYADLPMDYADSTLVVLAEDLRTDTVFTVDRDFTVYRLRGRKPFRIVPST